MAPVGCALLNKESSALAINVADETMQADLAEHIATLVFTCLLLCGGVLLDGLRRHTR
jgi:hypothetical protein